MWINEKLSTQIVLETMMLSLEYQPLAFQSEQIINDHKKIVECSVYASLA